jgi:hypothetical protein
LIQEFRGYNTWDGEATTIEGMSNGVFPSFSRRVKLLRDLTANLTRGLIRNLIN